MKETQIVNYQVKYLRGMGYKVETEYVGYIDIVAIKGDEWFIIEAKGDQLNTGQALQTLIGQIVSRMNKKAGVNRKYGITISAEHFRSFLNWGIEGLKSLSIHLFLVYKNGKVEHLTPHTFVERIRLLNEKVGG